MNVKSI